MKTVFVSYWNFQFKFDPYHVSSLMYGLLGGNRVAFLLSNNGWHPPFSRLWVNGDGTFRVRVLYSQRCSQSLGNGNGSGSKHSRWNVLGLAVADPSSLEALGMPLGSCRLLFKPSRTGAMCPPEAARSNK